MKQMKYLKKLLVTALVMGSLAFTTASAEMTVVTVSMQKLFEGFYKSAEASQRIESIRAQAISESEAKQAELGEMVEAIRLMQEELQNPVLSDAKKEEKQGELQAKADEARMKQAEFQQWQQQTMNNLNQRGQEIRNTLIEEIIKVVTDVALKEESADLVFDTSDTLGTPFPTVLYADSDLDITDKVLSKLNQDAPNN
jgi:Skp family chaperone for outer membrane proteins